MAQADTLSSTSAALDPFALGGPQSPDAAVSAAELRLLRTLVGSLWVAGHSEKWTSLVLTIPSELAEELFQCFERDLFDDCECVSPDGEKDEAEELDILFKALRERERMAGAIDYINRSRPVPGVVVDLDGARRHLPA